MTIKDNRLEFNILGTQLRLSQSDSEDNKGKEAIQLVKEEIAKVKQENPKVKDSDIAVLVALSLASKSLNLKSENTSLIKDFKDFVLPIKEEAKEAVKMIEESLLTRDMKYDSTKLESELQHQGLEKKL